MTKDISQNKMGTKPVKTLLLSMGLPMIISMAMQAVYNIVDSYFVSGMADTAEIHGMGDYAVNALTLSFPVQMLMIAIGVGTGVGINALLSRSLGERDTKTASKIAGNSIFLGICSYVVFLLFGLFGVKAFMQTQTTSPVVLQMGTEYLGICTQLSFGAMMYISYEKLLQATGRTMLSTIAQISGAVTNIILDPIMIFGFAGIPAMGIAGAAYATVIGQFVSFLLDAIFHYAFNKRDFDTSIKYIRPRKKIIGQIYKIGVPAILMQALMSFMTYGANIILNMLSASAVTAFGVYYKIQQFVFFAAFGMNNAIIPIIAFNYGKGDKARIKQGIRYGIIYTLIIMVAGIILLQCFAWQLVGIFAVSEETKALCVTAIRIITLGYLFAGANIAYQGIFQALGYGMQSLILSLLRLIVIALPLAYIFTLLPAAQTLVWAAFPAAEALSAIAAVIMMKQIMKKVSALL